MMPDLKAGDNYSSGTIWRKPQVNGQGFQTPVFALETVTSQIESMFAGLHKSELIVTALSLWGAIGLALLAPARTHAGGRDEWLQRMRPIVPQSYVCRHTSGPLAIDGQLDEPAWADAPWTEAFCISRMR